MSEGWAAVCIGFFLVVFGFAMTAVSGAMPGAKPLYQAPLRFRLILVCFGVLIFLFGVVRLIYG